MTAASATPGWAYSDLLDLAAVDVLAARDDHVLLAVDDVEEALLVAAGHVAGVEPPAAERLARSPRAFQ